MKLSLRTKLTASHMALALLLVFSFAGVSSWVLHRHFDNYILEKQQKDMEVIMDHLNDIFTEQKTPDLQTLGSIRRMALSRGFVLRIQYKGNELVLPPGMGAGARRRPDVRGNNGLPGFYPTSGGVIQTRKFDITAGDKVCGKATFSFFGPLFYANSDLHFLSFLNRLFLTGGILSLFLALLLGAIMAGHLSTPLKKVIESTRDIERGEYSRRVNCQSDTVELQQLIQSVNNLALVLEHQQALRHRLAQDYAHELRTPLATLSSHLEAMIDGIWEPTTARLSSCYEEIGRLTRMIKGVEDLVTLEEQKPSLSCFNLKKLAEAQCLNFQAETAEKSLILSVEGDDFDVKADRDKMGQIILNLLSNAIKYSNNGGKITVTLEKNDTAAILKVKDEGIGIDQKDIPFIFEHLYRVDHSRSSGTGGKGIGLAVVKAAVLAHKGTVSVNSVPGKGSEFIVKIPQGDQKSS